MKCRAFLNLGDVCSNPFSCGPDAICLAKVGSSVLFFDDVEDEFAVGRLGDDGVISSPGLAGELRSAHDKPLQQATATHRVLAAARRFCVPLKA